MAAARAAVVAPRPRRAAPARRSPCATPTPATTVTRPPSTWARFESADAALTDPFIVTLLGGHRARGTAPARARYSHLLVRPHLAPPRRVVAVCRAPACDGHLLPSPALDNRRVRFADVCCRVCSRPAATFKGVVAAVVGPGGLISGWQCRRRCANGTTFPATAGVRGAVGTVVRVPQERGEAGTRRREPSRRPTPRRTQPTRTQPVRRVATPPMRVQPVRRVATPPMRVQQPPGANGGVAKRGRGRPRGSTTRRPPPSLSPLPPPLPRLPRGVPRPPAPDQPIRELVEAIQADPAGAAAALADVVANLTRDAAAWRAQAGVAHARAQAAVARARAEADDAIAAARADADAARSAAVGPAVQLMQEAMAALMGGRGV